MLILRATKRTFLKAYQTLPWVYLGWLIVVLIDDIWYWNILFNMTAFYFVITFVLYIVLDKQITEIEKELQKPKNN